MPSSCLADHLAPPARARPARCACCARRVRPDRWRPCRSSTLGVGAGAVRAAPARRTRLRPRSVRPAPSPATTEGLCYVSPRSRPRRHPRRRRQLCRPPARPAGLPDRGRGRPRAADIAAAFRLTGHFLSEHVWGPRQIDPPSTREALVVRWQPDRASAIIRPTRFVLPWRPRWPIPIIARGRRHPHRRPAGRRSRSAISPMRSRPSPSARCPTPATG